MKFRVTVIGLLLASAVYAENSEPTLGSLKQLPLPEWFESPEATNMTANALIDGFVDRVSVSGCQPSDQPGSPGEIPEYQKQMLRELRKWLKVNGEAVYESERWKVAAEGPTQPGKETPSKFTAKDIRYTQSKDGKFVYAIVLDRPNDEVVLTGINGRQVLNVSLLGHNGNVQWSKTDQSMVIKFPVNAAGQHAYVFRIDL